MKMLEWIKENKLEIAIICGALVAGTVIGYRSGVTIGELAKYTNRDQGLTFKANPEWDAIDLFKRTKDGLDHLWVIDYGEAQILSAELVEAMSELHPA